MNEANTFYRLQKERINVGLNRINGLYDHLNGRREQQNDAKFSPFRIACVCAHKPFPQATKEHFDCSCQATNIFYRIN